MISMMVKICCIQDMEEAQFALDSGASAIGLVGKMPSGPGILSVDKIQEILKALPSDTDTFLLTSEVSAREIILQHQSTPTKTIQIVDEIPTKEYQELRKHLPDTKLVQVIHVLDEASIQMAVETSNHADMLLLDSGNPNLKVKVLGGTGQTHNWEISRKICQRVNVPVFLAGGLHAENVSDAISAVRPAGVDICSGVRTNGALDPKKLDNFMKSVYNTFQNHN